MSAIPCLSITATADLSILARRFSGAAKIEQAPEMQIVFSRMATRTGKREVRGRPLNLALQGGGAHGAFTWGVLDRLLEADGFAFDSISGTSAGAVNAVALAAGMVEGGAAGAREKLAAVWEAVARGFDTFRLRSRDLAGNGDPPLYDDSAAHWLFDVVSRVYSPYDAEHFDYDPLREILETQIDFKSLQRNSGLHLIIAATDVSTGESRLFPTAEITLDVVLASACIPTLRKAVKIGRRYYWDGGFSANPPLLPLVLERGADDTLLIKLNAGRETALPMKAQEIAAHATRLAFNRPLRCEIETIETCRRMMPTRSLLRSRGQRRLMRHRFHAIDGGKYTAKLAATSRLTPDWDLLRYLHARGRAETGRWLGNRGRDVGRKSSIELSALLG